MTNPYQPPQGRVKRWVWHAKRFWKECLRVLKVTKKPDKVEFQTITKVTGLGMLVIGAIGFLIYLVREFVTRVLL